MVSDLVAFIRARLDEDEAVAKAVLGWTAAYSSEDKDFAERFDPARVLREMEAARNILARFEDCLLRMEDPDYPAGVARDQAREYEDFVLPNLAAVYRDHRDYDPDMAP